MRYYAVIQSSNTIEYLGTDVGYSTLEAANAEADKYRGRGFVTWVEARPFPFL
jgi:hypothetical protein